MAPLSPAPVAKLATCAAVGFSLTGCGALISEAEFGGRWRIAEHRIENVEGGSLSSINPGFFDCNASYPGPPDSFTGARTVVGGCLFFLNEQYDPVNHEFFVVLDPEGQLVTTLVDTDRLEEQIAVLTYAGGQVPFTFTELTGGYEMRAADVVWDGSAPPFVPSGTGYTPGGVPDMDIVLLITKE
jgi:hypothetical protein